MAARYWVPGGSGAWNNTNNWSDTSGGASGFSIPGGSDDVYFDANSGAGNSQVVSSTINSLDCTGFTGSWSGTGTLTINSGIITMSASMTSTWTGSLTPLGVSTTITSAGFLWNSLVISTAGQTITLVGNMSVTQYVHSSTGTTNTINGDNLIWRGTGSFSITSGRTLTGTSLIVLAATSGNFSISGSTNSNFEINSTGTISQTSSVVITGGVWTYVTGNWSVGLQAFTASNCTLDLDGITLGVFTCSTIGSTITLTSTLNCNTVSIQQNTTFAGTHGFIADTLTIGTGSIGGRTLTLKAGLEYIITGELRTLSIGMNSRCTIKSDTPGTQTILTLTQGANAFPAFVNITDVDSSRGRLCKTFNGTLSNTTNWLSVTSDVPTVNAISIN